MLRLGVSLRPAFAPDVASQSRRAAPGTSTRAKPRPEGTDRERGGRFILVKVARARGQRAEHRRQVDEAAGQHVHDLAFALDAAIDAEKARAEQLAALAIRKIAADDHV